MFSSRARGFFYINTSTHTVQLVQHEWMNEWNLVQTSSSSGVPDMPPHRPDLRGAYLQRNVCNSQSTMLASPKIEKAWRCDRHVWMFAVRVRWNYGRIDSFCCHERSDAVGRCREQVSGVFLGKASYKSSRNQNRKIGLQILVKWKLLDNNC